MDEKDLIQMDEKDTTQGKQYEGSLMRKNNHINLNEKIFNDYINKQCNKPTDLLMSPFHPFYFITYDFRC